MKNKYRNKKACLGFTILIVMFWSLIIPISSAVSPKISATTSLSSGQEWSISYGYIPEGDTISVSVTVSSGEISICGILDSVNRDDFIAEDAVYWEAGWGEDISDSWSNSHVAPVSDTYYFCAVSYTGSVTFSYTITHGSVVLEHVIQYIITGVCSGIFLAIVLIINKISFTGSIKFNKDGSQVKYQN